ncbi:peptidoglycan bridge formation glycyltransferase FemA/FemB family protein [Candidatus Saccharibacteria bacterium]|nr:peptidoglycan bridge formation glycyltransferase FemA/FemB family protein [Candidatus Saccharibacteria bacterium]
MFSFSELSLDDFSAFAGGQSSSNFLQSPFAFSRYQKKSQEAYLLGVYEKNKKTPLLLSALVVLTSSRRGLKIFSVPGGPVVSDALLKTPSELSSALAFFFNELKSFLKKKSGAVLELSPNLPFDSSLAASLKSLGFKELGELAQPKWISTLDLSKFDSPATLLASFRDTHCHSIRYSDSRFHLETRELSRSELPVLKSLSDLAAKRHSFRPQSLAYFEEMFDAFGDHLKVVAAFAPPESSESSEPPASSGKPLAAGMFLLYGPEVVYLYSGSDPEENKKCGSYAVQWYMLEYALKHGYKTYNFYGTHPFQSDGVFRFKAGFRAEVKELMGTFALPLSLPGRLWLARKPYKKYSDVA